MPNNDAYATGDAHPDTPEYAGVAYADAVYCGGERLFAAATPADAAIAVRVLNAERSRANHQRLKARVARSRTAMWIRQARAAWAEIDRVTAWARRWKAIAHCEYRASKEQAKEYERLRDAHEATRRGAQTATAAVARLRLEAQQERTRAESAEAEVARLRRENARLTVALSKAGDKIEQYQVIKAPRHKEA